MKAAKQREDQMKRFRDKIKKAAEEKRKKKEKQKENKFIMKKITLKKQKQAKQWLAEIKAKRKFAEEAKILKVVPNNFFNNCSNNSWFFCHIFVNLFIFNLIIIHIILTIAKRWNET